MQDRAFDLRDVLAGAGSYDERDSTLPPHATAFALVPEVSETARNGRIIIDLMVLVAAEEALDLCYPVHTVPAVVDGELTQILYDPMNN